MDDKLIMTQQGQDELKKELEERKTKTRTSVADEIETARQQGDLSENSAYKHALENKEFNEARISQLEDMINNSEINAKNKKGVVGIGSKVKIQNTGDNTTTEFAIVGQSESDPAKGKISNSSPIGAALMDKKTGDKVEVELPAGKVVFVIKQIK